MVAASELARWGALVWPGLGQECPQKGISVSLRSEGRCRMQPFRLWRELADSGRAGSERQGKRSWRSLKFWRTTAVAPIEVTPDTNCSFPKAAFLSASDFWKDWPKAEWTLSSERARKQIFARSARLTQNAATSVVVGSGPTTRTILLHEPKQPQHRGLDRA